MTIGEKILTIRKEKMLSQEEFADKLGVSRQAVSKWELDDSVPDIEKITLISKTFHVSTDSLLLDNINLTSAPLPEDTAKSETKLERAAKTAGKTAKKYFYTVGYVLIVFGIINLLFSIILGLVWNGFATELSGFLSGYNISLNLQFLFWLFVFMALVAVLTLGIGIFIITKFKKNKTRI